jgi:hypothetical protein
LVPTRDAALAIAAREQAQLDSVEAEAIANGDAAALQHVASARALALETHAAIAAMPWPSEASAWINWDGKSPINAARAFAGADVVRAAAPADGDVTTSNALPVNDDAAFSDDDDDDDDDGGGERFRPPPGLFDEPAAGSNSQGASSDEAEHMHVFFYQSADQQPFFLHPLCMGALVREHGTATALPHELSAALVECEARYMDDRQRRRERALAHLPAATNFAMLEVDLRSLVSRAVLLSLQPTLDDRAARRSNEKVRLARDERNAAQRADAAAATRAARIASAMQGRAMPAPQQKPNLADFRPLSATVAPSPVAAPSESASAAQDAWRRLNARSGGGRGGVVHAPEPEYDEEAAYAPPGKLTLSLEDFIVPARGRRR